MGKDLVSKVGMEFEPYQFTIERGKIKEFALAIGDDNPIYFDREAAQQAGFRDVPMPPSFATVIDLWAGPDFESLVTLLEMNPLKVLHGEQGYDYLNDICAGDEISVKTRVTEAITKKGMNLITTEKAYTNQHNEQVLVARAVVIERH
ncbi:MaoC family dehydratase N-terminal domain-containing protein [Sporosarcina sp. FSL K6-1522]|uniref:MaoC family dehydratase N-terminal domain-containing protein n=1 Tax=Sporosarcina sp. FSL K6-1522 TaxID=2921554 RepID=UPI003159E54D